MLMYDEAGHLVGEYGTSGNLVREYIWMGDTPVAVLTPNGSSVNIYYVHADHLGTPRKVTRPSDNALMYRWDPDTFGYAAANSNPSGQGAFTFNLRFPGQFNMNESGLNYNIARTYDPQVGRYIEADPIGLRGGVNPYAYVGGNPISDIDPLGLWLISGGFFGSNVAPAGAAVGGGFYLSYANGQWAYGAYTTAAVEGGLNISCSGLQSKHAGLAISAFPDSD